MDGFFLGNTALYRNKTQLRMRKEMDMGTTQKKNMDMTQGTLWNKLLIFALPLAATAR